ncbi:MAG: hypothetical protein WBM66_17870, partial [Thiothrix litoralis]
DFWPESTDGTDSAELNEWHPAQPLTLAALNGKHLSFDITGDPECTAQTFSFSDTVMTVRNKCSGKVTEDVMTAEEVVGAKNLLKVTAGTIQLLLALTEGDVTKGKMVMAQVENSKLTGIYSKSYTAVSTSLQP